MTDKLFLYDYKTGQAYTWAQLLEDINSAAPIPAVFQSKGLYSTFLNIINAIINNASLTLLDSNFSEQELIALGIQKDEYAFLPSREKYNFNDISDLTDEISRHQDWQLTLFTSGTTGIPKKVTHSLKSLTRAVKSHDKRINDVWGFAYNPTHMAGLQVFFQALLNGNTVINLFEADRITALDLITKYRITNISATPTFYRMLMPLETIYLGVKNLTSGGEKFDVKLSEHLAKAFPNARMHNIYASTEAGTILETRDEVFSITDDNLCMIKDSELYIHKSLTGAGEEVSFTDGEWYATGDLVQIISENPTRFRFLSRRNEMINVGGYKVNPHETEQALESHPYVLQAYVYGKENSLTGNVLMADLIVSEPLSEKELRSFLTPLLQPYKIPRIISFVDKINLTRSGKLKRT
jgi:acyl-coenzyme A synthetase/AMP-(fatty) acid ligase